MARNPTSNRAADNDAVDPTEQVPAMEKRATYRASNRGSFRSRSITGIANQEAGNRLIVRQLTEGVMD